MNSFELIYCRYYTNIIILSTHYYRKPILPKDKEFKSSFSMKTWIIGMMTMEYMRLMDSLRNCKIKEERFV